MSNTVAPPALMPRVKGANDDAVFNPGHVDGDASAFGGGAAADARRRPSVRRPAHKRHVSGFSLSGGADEIDPLGLTASAEALAAEDPNQLKRTKSMGVDDLEAELRGVSRFHKSSNNNNDDDDDDVENDPSLDDIDNLSQRLASRRVSISSTPGDNDISQLVGFAVGPTTTSSSSTSASAAPSSPLWGAPPVPSSSSTSSSAAAAHQQRQQQQQQQQQQQRAGNSSSGGSSGFQSPGLETGSVLGRRENPMALRNNGTNKISRKNSENNAHADVSAFNVRPSEHSGSSNGESSRFAQAMDLDDMLDGGANDDADASNANKGRSINNPTNDQKNNNNDADDDDDDADDDDDDDDGGDNSHLHSGSQAPSDNDSTEMNGWHLDEDSQLKELVEKFGKEWAPIAERISNRADKDCQERWEQLTKSPYKKGTWTPEEDARLRRLIENVEKRNWGEVASLIPGRSAKQCRERWCYNLDPTINKTPWKPEEDSVLMKSQLELGNKWAKIASMLPGRTENAVKTRFKSIMRAKKREWMPEEDQTIMRLHQQLGSRWDAIAEKLPNRSKNAIKTRYRALSKGITSQLPQTGAPNQILRRPEFRATIAPSSSSPSGAPAAPSVPSFPQFGQGTGGDGLRKGFASAPPPADSKPGGAAAYNGMHVKVRPAPAGFAAPDAPPPKVVNAASQHKPRSSSKMKPKVQRDPQTDLLNGLQQHRHGAGDFTASAQLDHASTLDLFAGKATSGGFSFSNHQHHGHNHGSGPGSAHHVHDHAHHHHHHAHHNHHHHNPLLGNFSDSHGSFEDLASGLTQSKFQGRRNGSSSSFGWIHASGSNSDLFGLHHSDSRGQLAGPGFGSGSGAMQGLDRAGLGGAGFRTVQEVEETFMNDDDVPLQDDELVDFLNMWDQSAPPGRQQQPGPGASHSGHPSHQHHHSQGGAAAGFNSSSSSSSAVNSASQQFSHHHQQLGQHQHAQHHHQPPPHAQHHQHQHSHQHQHL